ncbi:hypothetical protein [Streptomyces sp. NPDC047000]|uniref:hypothetical protein n=1 Tax=Streptomyces sp. NPDC047000 TaxID=3155474 RepID=UPI0033F39583
MLRITDARTGESADPVPARRGLTRIEVHTRDFTTTALRVLLVADLLQRALEIGGTPVWALLDGDRHQADLRAAGAALGIRPFEDSRGLGEGLGEAQVVHVAAADTAARLQDPGGVVVAVAPVTPAGPAPVYPAGGTDPAVPRLALLSRHHADPLHLDAAVLDAARDTLARRRRAVADWARRPSRPVPDEVRARLRRAWEDDLDVPAVLEILETVAEHPDLPDGARFETYAYADRLLGLDLTRDLGSPA